MTGQCWTCGEFNDLTEVVIDGIRLLVCKKCGALKDGACRIAGPASAGDQVVVEHEAP